ncbi:hypothetical protein [Pseudomonas piscis]|uniref:hypothetical protein n=1 Tax=Pseudomonas piscis TaxID=2614538 RepID=UPI0003B5FE94|nr:hypothetical protein [Pseudomonas piscis]ERO64274.1 hypothetical protein P308_24910 [Pseudomonas piscis]
MTDASPTPTPAKSRRGLNFLIITLVALALILVAGAWWLLYGRLYESTDNAYVRGDVILVSAQARGTATAVHIQNTDTVKAGDAWWRSTRSTPAWAWMPRPINWP